MLSAKPVHAKPVQAFRASAGRFLIAATISFYGDWLTTVGLVVVLYEITGSAVAPAGYILARAAPRLLGPAPGGALADRFSPARVIVACYLAQAALTATIIGATWARSIWPIYVAVLLSQFLGAMVRPCQGALIPHLVEARGLNRVNALYGSSYASSIFVAPAVGALLLAHGGVQLLLSLDVLSFIIGAALILTLPHGRTDGDKRSATSSGAFAGLTIAWKDPLLRTLAGGYLSNAAVITGVQAVLVVVAAQRYQSANYVGWLYSAVGCGGLVGSFVALRWKPTVVQRSMITAGILVELGSLLAFIVFPPLWSALAFLGLSSFGGILFQTYGATALQHRVARDTLGRVNAAVYFAQYTGMLLGAVAALLLVAPLGWELALLLLCAVGAAIVVAFSFGGSGEKQRSANEVVLSG